MGGRVQYLDILKAIAIFLVVFCHFVLLPESVSANLWMSACWMAVPVFFMVNGALLFSRPFHWKKHIRKTVGIYCVFTVWKAVYLLVIPPATGTTVTSGIWKILTYLFLFGELPEIINGHLWFIEALLAVYLVYPVFRMAYDAADVRCRRSCPGDEAKADHGPSDSDLMSGKAKQEWQNGPGSRKSQMLLCFFAAAGLLCTNGLYSLEILGDMLRDIGIPFGLSFQSLAAFQPFGKYGNMLGFFLLGALLNDGGIGLAGKYFRKPDRKRRRLMGGGMLAAGLLSLWGVKWYLSGRPEWDGYLLQEGYRHIPVILMASGLFLACQDLRIRTKWLSAAVEALASRTLGIFYIHWLMGWILVNPLAAWFMTRGISFGVWTNLLKNIMLMVPAFLLTIVLERIPGVKKLVKG